MAIHHYGAISHSRAHFEGHFRQETRTISTDEAGEGPAPVKIIMKDGILLESPEIIVDPPIMRGGTIRRWKL